MPRNLFRGFVLIAVVGVTSCMNGSRPEDPADTHAVANQFIPVDARDQQTAPDIPWTQISFRVLRAPLDYAFDEERLAERTAEGWLVCRPESAQWLGYDDLSVTPARYVQSRTWVLYKDGWQVILTGLYFSGSAAQAVTGSGDATTRVEQQGVISARQADLAQARQIAASFDLRCAEPEPN